MSSLLWLVAKLAFVASSLAGTPQAWVLGPFSRPINAPVIVPDKTTSFQDPNRGAPVHWEALHTFNPAAIVREGKIVVLYRAEDDTGEMRIGLHTSRLGLATSSDGINFVRSPKPVFFPDLDGQHDREWPGGVEDPRIVQAPDGSYVITYTQWNRVTYSIGIATSPDLEHWTKRGPAFLGSAGGRYDKLKYKSGGIVTTMVAGHLEAARIKGLFWMYWGEGAIHLASSPDLIHWTPVEDGAKSPVEVLRKRPGHFDSGFPEVGPPPVLTERGIVMIYNGKNDPANGEPTMGPNAYAAGEALFAADDPARLLERTEAPVLKPEQPFEKTGQYVAGTTFAEGLVYFQKRWFLFYGCADSSVAVAVSPAP